MKPKIVIGNWKMNKNFDEAEDLISEIEEKLADYNFETEIVLCPPLVYAELVTDHANEEGSQFYAGVQNVSEYENGAYTGEVSAEMLAGMDVSFCIVGHSERRKYFGETNEIVLKKMLRLLANDIVPVMCCGESLDERKSGKHFEIVQKQLEESVYQLTPEQMERVIIAYEPIWAIGTGLTATAEQAEEIHAYIRSIIAEKYGQAVADDTTILYGGSCKASNAPELFAKPDIDGGLIGGASLKAADFKGIIDAWK